ncbi:MAG: ion transporter [Rikenellaceae bacterium]
MRRHLFDIIDNKSPSISSISYAALMVVAIVASIAPLMFRERYWIFTYLEIFGCSVFIFDYIAKWITADYRTGRAGFKAFLLYPFTPWAIFDLITILPSFNILNRGLITIRVLRLLKIIRVLRIFERSKHIDIIVRVIKTEAATLWNVLILCLIYILVSALIIFNFESVFETFFDALYWATTALTTMEYGDVCPSSNAGKFISMISSLIGIAIVALPSGIITARYLEELSSYHNREE